VREQRGRRKVAHLAQCQRLLAQRVVRALRRRYGRVGVPAGPRLDAGVEIQRVLVPAELDQRDARHVDRQVEQEIAAPDQRVEHALVILPRQRLLDEAHAVFRRFLRARVVCGDDRDAVGRDTDVTQDERQDSLPDAAEADENETAREIHVDRVVAHALETSKA
jgi:hypothetical protein